MFQILDEGAKAKLRELGFGQDRGLMVDPKTGQARPITLLEAQRKLEGQPLKEQAPSITETKPVSQGTLGSLAQPASFEPINISTINPALQNLGNQVNTLLAQFQQKGGTLNPEIQNLLTKINNFELDKSLALADARSAADKQDVRTTNEAMAKVDETEETEKDTISQLIEEMRKTRETFITSLTPTERGIELRSKLNTLRTERQLLPLELRKEGISAPGIQARQGEDERVRAIQEQNLLLEIGLEQEVQQFKTAALEKQLSFITDDINLQFKIQDKLDKDEQQVLDNARDLRKDSLSAMSDILESFEGLAFEDLDIESQAEVLDLAKSFDIPVNLLATAMKVAKQQKVLDNALTQAKIAKELGGGIMGIPTGEIPNVVNDAFRFASIGLPENQREFAQGTLNNLLSQERFDEAADFLKNIAIEGAPSSTQPQSIGREIMLANIEEIRRSLEEYEAAGGSTGRLSGPLKRFIEGTIISTEAPLREIEAKINAAIISYTMAVSGAQFSDAEAQRYEELFPAINQRKQVNFANLNALENNIMVSQEAFFKQRLGKENYNRIFKTPTPEKTGEPDFKNMSDEEIEGFIKEQQGGEQITPESPESLEKEFNEVIGKDLTFKFMPGGSFSPPGSSPITQR